MTVGGRAVAACILGILPAVVLGEDSTIRRDDAKAYKALDQSRRLPRLDRGDTQRTLAPTRPPPRHQPPDRARAGVEARRQLAEATCEADLVVVGRVESSVPFVHPNGKWVLTAHDVAVTQDVRARGVGTPAATRVRYIHPSGQVAVAGRVVTTTLDWFPPLVADDELLFFLVKVGTSATYRTSLRVPPLALRGGTLRDPGATAEGRRAALDGASAFAAIRAVKATVCRPPPSHPERRPSDEDWPWPESPEVRPDGAGAY